MFEKDAEEYLYDRLDPKAIDSVSEISNKHIEEVIVSSFKDGAEFGYNKANEWHDLRKDNNDLPRFRRNILVTCEYRSKLKKKRETFEWDYNSEMPLHAIAWCEIPTFDKE